MIKTVILILLLLVIVEDSQDEFVFSFDELGNKSFLDLTKKKKLIFIGETHGTKQVPEFMLSLVQTLNYGDSISIGFEISSSHQSNIDSFFLTGNRQILENLPFFNSKYPDGRSSIAMMGLLVGMYNLTHIKVFCFDVATYFSSAQERDSIMAINIIKQCSKRKTIVLTGGNHARLRQVYMRYKSAALFVKDKYPSSDDILSLKTAFGGGTAWGCLSADYCGEINIYPNQILEEKYGDKGTVVIFQQVDSAGYNGYVYIPEASVSEPFKRN